MPEVLEVFAGTGLATGVRVAAGVELPLFGVKANLVVDGVAVALELEGLMGVLL